MVAIITHFIPLLASYVTPKHLQDFDWINFRGVIFCENNGDKNTFRVKRNVCTGSFRPKARQFTLANHKGTQIILWIKQLKLGAYTCRWHKARVKSVLLLIIWIKKWYIFMQSPSREKCTMYCSSKQWLNCFSS